MAILVERAKGFALAGDLNEQTKKDNLKYCGIIVSHFPFSA
jgi:hypothetical protein